MNLSSFFDLSKNHKVLLTGGSRGIGNAVGKLFRECGVEVIAPAREILDLNSNTSVDSFIREYEKHGIDILINNAGINIINCLEKIKTEDWERMLRINLTSAFQLIQGFAPGMQKKKWGRIINVSSIFGVVSREGRAAYSATKAGINGLTRTSAIELGPDGILVNSICPGYVDTELTRKNNSPSDISKLTQNIPLRRLAQVDEIAKMIVFLTSDFNSYMTGQTIIVDGGFTCQ